jgi:CHASE2 domain-containing sensor protein
LDIGFVDSLFRVKMERLVTIEIRSGNRDFGYHVSLQIAEEYLAPDGKILLSPQVEIAAELPSAREVLGDYFEWQQIYRKLDLNYRLEADQAQITNISTANLKSKCQVLAKLSMDSFDRWLNTASFQPIREQLARSIKTEDRVRFILQIDDLQLHRLPWQMSDLFSPYSSTEVVLSSPQFERVEQLSSTKSKVRILAILGNSQGVNVEVDRQILKTLIDADVEFLVEPSRQELTDRLWKQQWDILFFAGHSSSSEDNSTGQIWIDRTDRLSLEELKFGLKKAIANGLKIAIFNSCDGLGLIPALANLQIPQVIVMREPVPDCVAQDFLTGFLTLYARGNSFYRSVREAREKLQGFEDKFPCATWLPTIYQQGIDPPPTWKQLQGSANITKQELKVTLFSSIFITLAISATRFLGILQPLELTIFDLTMRSRPVEIQDLHTLVVEVRSEDVEQQKKDNQLKDGSSLSNRSLDRLLELLDKHQPQIVGVDTFLNRDIPDEYKSIKNGLASGSLVPVCKVKSIVDRDPEIPPPVGATLVGFADTIADGDGVMRRHLLSMDAQPGNCHTAYALSTMLAYKYLQAQPNPLAQSLPQKIDLKLQPHRLQLGEHQFDFLESHRGGYQQVDERGYQLLLNYRFSGSLTNAIRSISLAEIFTLPEQQLQELIENKVILIGTTDNRYKDISKTPYPSQNGNRCPEHERYECISGVFLQAQMTSQLISAALENRPLLWAAPFWVDGSIVLICSTIGSFLGWRVRNRWLLIIFTSTTLIILWSGSISLLAMTGYWFPLLPTLLGVVMTISCANIYLNRDQKSPVIYAHDKI